MNFDQYSKIFEDKAIDNGYSYENIQKCLSYAKPLIDKELPVIFNTSHLASHVGYSKRYLKKAALFTSYFYREFTVRKKSGGTRTISEPLPSLKEIQHWILNRILYKIEVSKFAKAYIPNKTLKEHIRFHKRQKIVVTLDIQDFFGSIKRDMIESVIKRLGYSELVSNLLAKLCSLNNVLPQGAPTSPFFSNIIFKELDEQIGGYCLNKGIKYSRYADDMAFSGDFNVKDLIVFVESIISKKGFVLNDKTQIMQQNQPQIISGILVNKKFQLPRKDRDELRQSVYYIEKFGLDNHLTRIGCNKANYIKHLLGIANYMIFINPNDVKIKKLYNTLLEYKDSSKYE
jgi:RNA-directed DNA polymerase